MNGTRGANAVLLSALVDAEPFAASVVVCPPFPYLADVAVALRAGSVSWGAQDCSAHAGGAFTGETSAAMLADLGCSHVIVGHSERRAMHAEGDRLVAEKARQALIAGITPIVCVGETLAERDAQRTGDVVDRQLAAVIDLLMGDITRVVVAYEPVWAIGSGIIPTLAEVAEMHASIRALLGELLGEAGARVRILYGGSVKPGNAGPLLRLDNVDGALVGGASLKAVDFLAIAGAYR